MGSFGGRGGVGKMRMGWSERVEVRVWVSWVRATGSAASRAMMMPRFW